MNVRTIIVLANVERQKAIEVLATVERLKVGQAAVSGSSSERE
jgi:hypothetical protein